MKKHLTKSLAFLLLWGMSIEAGSCNSCSYTTTATRDPYCYSCEQVCPDECHFFIGAEGLCWTACDNDLDFATDFLINESTILGHGHTHFADYDWNWGVRGWMGWNWCCGWDSRLAYTWFKTDGDTIIDKEEDNETNLKASVLHPNTGLSDAEKATASLDLKYQTLDLLFGRTVTFCENSFVLHPFFGFRGLKLDQDQIVLYEGGDFVSTPTGFIGGYYATPARVTWESKLKGAGLTGGLDVNFRWTSGFGVFGSMGGSVLAAKTDVEYFQESLNAEGGVSSTEISLKEDPCVAVPGLHLQAGFNYHWSCGECLLVKFHVLYEFNNWFNTPHLRRYSYGNEAFSSSGSSGNVALQGITFGGEIFF